MNHRSVIVNVNEYYINFEFGIINKTGSTYWLQNSMK